MKKQILSVVVSIGLVSSIAFARGGNHGQRALNSQVEVLSTQVQTVSDTKLGLTQNQIDDLVFMYQEEKVARDVYTLLADTWGLRTFDKIKNAEQRHMDAVRNLLNKYSIDVPVANDTMGVFDNEELQSLYDDLVAKGLNSATDALEVGVLVEESDIADLEDKIIGTPSDIADVYNRLLRGSYNHLRAFNRALSGESSLGKRGRGRR